MSTHWLNRAGLVLAVLLLLAQPAGSQAADPRAGLSEAEAEVVAAEANMASADRQLDAARARYEAANRRAAPLAKNAGAARAETRALASRLAARQRLAKAEIAEREATHREEVEEHDKEVTFGIGIGLAALVAGGIALIWGRFRTSPAVTGLADIDRSRALALCLGGGFLVLVLGAALSGADGFVGASGAFLFGLGIVLPTTLLLARHSVEIERGNAKPVLGRERPSDWVARGIAALLLIIGIFGLGSSVLSDEPTLEEPPAELHEAARAPTEGPGARELAAAKSEARATAAAAAAPVAERQAAQAALREAARAARAARSALTRAEGKARRFTSRVVALEEREAREEREAVRTAEREEREAEELAEEESATPSGCDPNYTGCVPPYPPDVDCAEVGETVTVIGSDPHGLDADGDLVACE